MIAVNSCPKCKTPLSPAVLNGLCPRCVLQAAIDDDAVESTGPWVGQSGRTFVPPSVAEIQAKFPQLQVTELVGAGGMGAVYRALQPGLDRVVAIKILPAERREGTEFADRFAREAKMLAMLNHPNIVAVYDFGQKEDLCYIVMEYVEGTTLRHVIQGGNTTPERALELVSQVAGAMQYAHEQGIVHRDIKPENILIDLKGRVKIADFGLAKLSKRNPYDGHLTRTMQVMGTLRYMAPEQIEKTRDVDHRADIYSVGVVLYELLTRELPIGRFPLPSEKLGISKAFDDLVLRSLEKSVDRRYQLASTMKTAIDNVLAGRPTTMIGQLPARLGRVFASSWTISQVALVVIAVVLVIALAPALITMGIVLGIGVLVYRAIRGNLQSRPAGENRFARKTQAMARFAWRYNPIAVLFRTLVSRGLWLAVWAAVCVGAYVLFWWPAWELGGESKRIDGYGPGIIDREVWPYSGYVAPAVRLRPTNGKYQLLNIKLELEGNWSGFDDARLGIVPKNATANRLTLELLDNKGDSHMMHINNLARGGEIFFGTPQTYTEKLAGPVDTNMVRRWLELSLKGNLTPAELDELSAALMEIIIRTGDRNRYEYPSLRVVGNQTMVEEGRLAHIVGHCYAMYPFRDGKKNYVFKEWVGTSTIEINPKRNNLLPLGIVVMAALLIVGWTQIGRALRPVSPVAPTASSNDSSTSSAS